MILKATSNQQINFHFDILNYYFQKSFNVLTDFVYYFILNQNPVIHCQKTGAYTIEYQNLSQTVVRPKRLCSDDNCNIFASIYISKGTRKCSFNLLHSLQNDGEKSGNLSAWLLDVDVVGNCCFPNYVYHAIKLPLFTFFLYVNGFVKFPTNDALPAMDAEVTDK
jgi:hypothetical protein